MTEPQTSAVSRRRLLGVAGAGALAVGAGVGGFAVGRAEAESPGAPGDATYPFNGEHQAGILTPTQDRLHFAAFDVTTDSRAELVALLKAWTDAAAEMTAGTTVGGGAALPYDSPPADTGEALDLSAAGLTLTFGFGPTLFEKGGKDRFGLKDRQPKSLRGAATLPGRQPRPGAQQRGHLHPGLRPRPPGRRTRNPQPGPDRLRDRCDPLGAARLRADVVHLDEAGDRTQPARLQGRHPQPEVRERRRHREVRLGSARRRREPPTGWPAAPTSSRGGSTCTSNRGTAPACASRRT